ncbi:hypothetical protein LCGC14_1296600 [marine sediment metagenome]|uniref:Uncharacterized protein n=1 Tax=marine sediment metagenome TaxID=412755 RepID=A0A0F9NTQ0_9ZZZZ|nr:hypothetical protein [Pricia sp.]
MKYKIEQRIIASMVVFIMTLGAMVVVIGLLLMAMEYGVFQVGVGIMTLVLLSKFSWSMGKVLIDHGYKD